MLVKAEATVRGAKMFKGQMDDGKKIDSGKLFVEMVLKESDNAFGMCTEAMKCKDSSVVESIKHTTFPFIAELDIDVVSGSKGMEQVVLAVRPMQAIKAAAKA
ncbi:hypothetical protein GJ697_01415 [Pseudoduganella sp. FT25W]|uniref:Uncharacterized protein n=1 Tax=Duganella alba TaxID=2666081 RepID=A0A6L5QA73_9BURK|nr:hypothetical protein [Duganella alba]MRX06490.1 hypothetical protein [Duganella alba]MRX14884.1 hypothetical protein [Duganella alba]